MQRNKDARSLSNFCRGKAICITNSECVFVALGIQHVTHMSRIILSSVVYLAVVYFST